MPRRTGPRGGFGYTSRFPHARLPMNPNYLDFEQPIADLEARIQDLRNAGNGTAVDVEVRTLKMSHSPLWAH